MTRILLMCLLLFSSIFAGAQFKKNDILLGGQLSYNYSSNTYTFSNVTSPTSDYKNNGGIITISAGKALNENTLFGVTLFYSPNFSTNYPSINGDIPLKYKSNGYGVGIYYRKYKSLGKEFYFYGGVAAGYNWSNNSGKDSVGQELISGSNSSIAANLYLGIAYRLSRHFFLELSFPSLVNVGYSKYNSSSYEGSFSAISKNDQFYFTTSFSSNPLTNLAIGIQLIL